MDSGKETPPNWYTDTPQLIHGHPPLIEFGSFLIKLEYHVDLSCLHLHQCATVARLYLKPRICLTSNCWAPPRPPDWPRSRWYIDSSWAISIWTEYQVYYAWAWAWARAQGVYRSARPRSVVRPTCIHQAQAQARARARACLQRQFVDIKQR